MNISDLGKILDNDLKKYYDVVLINGIWGVGKTFYINRYLKDEKSIYVSLFGLKNMEELKSNLYFSLNKMMASLKKFFSSLSGQQIVSIAIPSIKFDIEKSIRKELKNEELIIVIDDLERKNSNISFEDVLGFVESLSQISGVKIIVIANENEIKDDKDVYIKFKEKVIQKTYVIDNYSEEAVDVICSEYIKKNPISSVISDDSFYNIVCDFLSKFRIKNLRTLKKSILFSKEVFNGINPSLLNDSDKKEIVNICFAIVVEYNDGVYGSVSSSDSNIYDYILDKYFGENKYSSNKLNIIKLVCDYYLNTDNSLLKEIDIYYIVMHHINNQKKDIFYCSLSEVEERLNDFNDNSIKKVNPDLDISSWFKAFNHIEPWAERIGKTNFFKKKDILNIIEKYADLIDDSQELYSIIDSIEPFSLNDDKVTAYYKDVKNVVCVKYCERLINKIKKEISNNIYNPKLIEKLFGVLRNDYYDQKTKKTILKLIVSNNFFIPDLNSSLTSEMWRWTHRIWRELSYLSDDVKKVLFKISQEMLKTADIVGRYRIESLNKQYSIIKQVKKN